MAIHIWIIFFKIQFVTIITENYEISLEEGVTPTGLKLRKDPAFLPVSDRKQVIN